jgi:signal transduction histidine kinase
MELELLESHLSSRLRAGFNLGEIVDEFGLLGRAITATWSHAAPRGRPTAAEVDRLLAVLQAATTFVTAMFTQHLLTDEQTEKRYLRLLAESFHDPLDDASPLSQVRLRQALKVVMEAMAADTAALLLYNAKNHELVMTASAGLADEGLTGFARSLGPESLEGAIAASGHPSTTYDVETTTLDVTDALGKSGIRAVLGVRLPQHRALLGVMYIGLCQQRSFAPREMRRLEALAAQLALHLDNAKLSAELQAQIAALDAERLLRDQLVSVVAHDLRGPLCAARVASKILASKGVAAPDPERHLDVIARNLDRVDRMVTDLLDVERVHANEQLAINVEDTDLSTIARDVVTELAAQHPDRLVLRAGEGIHGLWDPALIRRAVWNLASNALKYGEANTPVLVSVEATSDGAKVVVHNEGAPISREQQATLFKPFSRAGARAGMGWGLGLTVVRGCAKAHGGRVELDSAPGRGTTFTLRIPLDPRAAARSAA